MIRSLGVNSIEKELNRFRGLRMITIIIQWDTNNMEDYDHDDE